MFSRKAVVVGGMIVAAWSAPTEAQIPGIPGGLGGSAIPGGAGAAAGGLGGLASPATAAAAAPAAAAAAPKSIFSFLGLSKAGLAGCKQKLCASPFGSLLNNGLAPYSSLSGGLIPQCCPTVPSNADIAALAAQGGPNGAEAVAAKIKQDEADAKARRAAIRYLATVDCHYWPDAEVAIISALRDDRNECVRYEAALALLNGCCCNARTIAALNMVVSGSEKDGKPAETSERVRCVALAALQGCLLRYHPPEPTPTETPGPSDAPREVRALDPSFRRVAYYYQALTAIPPRELVADARRTVALRAARNPMNDPPLPGRRSVYDAMARASSPRPPAGPSSDEARSPGDPAVAATSAESRPDVPGPRATEPAPIHPAARRTIFSSLAARSPGDDRSETTAPSPARAPSVHRGLFGIIRDTADPDR